MVNISVVGGVTFSDTEVAGGRRFCILKDGFPVEGGRREEEEENEEKKE